MGITDTTAKFRPLNAMIERITSRWRGFPNITTLGSYDHISQVIRLNALEKRDIEQVKISNDVDLKKKILPLMAHEGTHYLDHLATVWGQSNLVDVYNALHSRIHNDERQFWRIAELKSKSKRIHYADYYNITLEAGCKPWNSKPWKQTMTVGFEFGPSGKINDGRPILFLRFFTDDNRPVARVPLSIVSLLETTAMMSELDLELEIISTLPEDVLFLERKFFDKKYTERLYDGNLCVYSACAHLLANMCMVSNYVDAYRMAAKLAMLCLNIPRKAFARIKIPSHLFNRVPSIASYFRRTCDRAIAYYILLIHAPSVFNNDPEIWINELVKSSGLGSLEQLHREGDDEISKPKDLLHGPESARLSNLLRIGSILRKHRGYSTVSYFNVLDRARAQGDTVWGPAVLLGDDQVIGFGNPPTDADTSSEELISWIYRIYDYEAQMDGFLGACLT